MPSGTVSLAMLCIVTLCMTCWERGKVVESGVGKCGVRWGRKVNEVRTASWLRLLKEGPNGFEMEESESKRL